MLTIVNNKNGAVFADDTKIFREIREEKDEKMLQANLDSLQSWSDTWLLKLEAGQIGPKPNRPKVKSTPSQIGPKSNRPQSNRPHFCCLLLSTCKVK
jgi:hypothetical protein